MLTRIAGWLRPGGWFVASTEHPVVTAAPELGPQPCVVDNYAEEGRRNTTWFTDGVIKYHRRLSTILNAVLDAGLVLRRVLEPFPTTEDLAERPELHRHQGARRCSSLRLRLRVPRRTNEDRRAAPASTRISTGGQRPPPPSWR